MRAAVFLDRDGVLNRNVHYQDSGEWESPREPDDLAIYPGVAAALCALQNFGFPLFVVSNQPSFAKGKTTLEALHAVHRKLESELRVFGVEFTDAYYCFHHPNGTIAEMSGPCSCRKPLPYFLLQTRDRYGIDLAASWMIGDRGTDIACGRAAGARTIAIRSDNPLENTGLITPDFRAADLSDATKIILATLDGSQ